MCKTFKRFKIPLENNINFWRLVYTRIALISDGGASFQYYYVMRVDIYNKEAALNQKLFRRRDILWINSFVSRLVLSK